MPGQVTRNLPPEFAVRLRALMREQRIGSGRLGDLTGISPRLINKYKAGTTEPRDPFGYPTVNAEKLARALDVPVADLLPPLDLEEAA